MSHLGGCFSGRGEWNLFSLYSWIVPVSIVIAALVAAVTRRPRLATVLAVVVCVQTAMIYWPLAAFRVSRIDRVRRYVEEPVPQLQHLFAAIVVTLVLTAAYVAVVRLRHTRQATRHNALLLAVVLNALLLNLVWILAVFPPTRGWWPADWHRPELLGPFRPCRGAVLWWVDGDRAIPYVRIDDIWLRFEDPRRPEHAVRAVSGAGEWFREYYWLRDDEAAELRMRADDPSVIRCDSAARPERVAPASWHHLGWRP